MKPSDVTQYVFDVTIGLFLLFGLTTADVMALFGEAYSLHAHLMQVGLSSALSIGLTFVAYLIVYSAVSRLAWKLLIGVARLIWR